MWRRQKFFLQRVEEQQEGERNEDTRQLKTRFVHKEVKVPQKVPRNTNAVGVGLKGTIGRLVIEQYRPLEFICLWMFVLLWI